MFQELALNCFRNWGEACNTRTATGAGGLENRPASLTRALHSPLIMRLIVLGLEYCHSLLGFLVKA